MEFMFAIMIGIVCLVFGFSMGSSYYKDRIKDQKYIEVDGTIYKIEKFNSSDNIIIYDNKDQ